MNVIKDTLALERINDHDIKVTLICYEDNNDHYTIWTAENYWDPTQCSIEDFINNYNDDDDDPEDYYEEDMEEDDNVLSVLRRLSMYDKIDMITLRKYYDKDCNAFKTPKTFASELCSNILYCGFYSE